MRHRKQRPAIAWCAVVALVAALTAGCDPSGSGGGTAGATDADEPEAATPVAAVEIVPRDLSRRLSVSASVEPLARLRLAARTIGTLDGVEVEVGDRIASGEVLARLNMAEQRAELARAAAEEEEALLQLERTRELRGDGVVSPADYQRARIQAQVATSERELWETRVDFGTVRAPRDAVVTARYVEPGEAVESGETLFELAAMNALVVRPGVSELDVRHLSEGDAVPLRFDALPDATMESEIRRIFPTAEGSSRLVTVEIRLPGEAAERGVRPGYLARIRMPIDTRPDALAVPSGAIGESDGGRYVYLIEDERLRQQAVDVGVTRGQWTEITGGVEPGDVVLASSPADMTEDEAVRIVTWRG